MDLDLELLQEIKDKLDDVLYRDGELSVKDMQKISNLIEDLIEQSVQ